MKVMLGNLPVTVDSKEELDQLIEWYGNGAPAHDSMRAGKTTNGGNGGVAKDRLILEKLVEAADTGVLTTTLGDWLGRKGKAVAAALLQWAIRVNLVSDDTNNPLEKARPDGGRGWKLKSTFIPMGKKLLEEMK